ncbi:NAD(P)H-binding protein [Dactylosporangium sp. NPDC051484]|uniref:NAD(P)-dependent oxidoreductase n=1 Tax=Dactylosporangium sp. NPDC051484 TaxID=3154942 RepID=UPI00344C3FA6
MTSVGVRGGRQILAEARRRSIEATAVVRDPARYPDLCGAIAGDATDAGLVETAARGHDVAISAVYGADLDLAAYGEAMAALLRGLERAEVRRLLLIGVATTLPGDSGARRFAEPGFPAEWRPFSQARADELAVLERYDGAVDWVVFTPAAELIEDEGSSEYRIRNLGTALSYTALGAALLDEVAADRHHRTQLAVSGA